MTRSHVCKMSLLLLSTLATIAHAELIIDDFMPAMLADIEAVLKAED